VRSIVLRGVLAVLWGAHVPQRWAAILALMSITVDEKNAALRPTHVFPPRGGAIFWSISALSTVLSHRIKPPASLVRRPEAPLIAAAAATPGTFRFW
jgi:hypothetical protein